MRTESFKRGQEFENYVLKNLFPEEEFKLIHRTNSYEQNQIKFATDTTKPDFKFKCIKTGKEFYVEAKYRSKYIYKKIRLIDLTQYNRFLDIQSKEKTLILIILGIGGKPSKPNAVALISLNELEKIGYLELTEQTVKNHVIHQKPFSCNYFSKFFSSFSKKIKQKSFERILRFAYTILGILIIFMLGRVFSKSSTSNAYNTENKVILTHASREKIKNNISNYYKFIRNDNFSGLRNIFSNPIKRYYKKNEISFNQVLKEIESYKHRFPYTTTKILWDTYKLDKSGDDFIATYHLIHKIYFRKSKKWKSYYLKIFTRWDKNYKLKEIYEIKMDTPTTKGV